MLGIRSRVAPRPVAFGLIYKVESLSQPPTKDKEVDWGPYSDDSGLTSRETHRKSLEYGQACPVTLSGMSLWLYQIDVGFHDAVGLIVGV